MSKIDKTIVTNTYRNPDPKKVLHKQQLNTKGLKRATGVPQIKTFKTQTDVYKMFNMRPEEKRK